MFNLEKFQAEFKAGRFDEFHYYSTLAKELTRMKETVSLTHLSESRAAQLDSIAFDRFVNITGEKNNFECSLLIDTETGYLYSPQWFNTNNRTFATIHDYETFVAQQVIAGVNDWELIDRGIFENFAPDIRINWFNEKDKNNVIIHGSFFYYSLWDNPNDKDNYKTHIKRYFNINSHHGYNYVDESIIAYSIKDDIYFLGKSPSFIKNKLTKNLLYNCELVKDYFPDFNFSDFKNEKIYSIGEAYPFIYSRRFVDLDIWGNKFSAFTFIQFLVDNDFDTSFLPKAPNLIPYILETLQKTTGIRLHEDTITFPSRFFKHESAISEHQNLLAYLDFLLWKIEYFEQRQQAKLSKLKCTECDTSETKPVEIDNTVSPEQNNVADYTSAFSTNGVLSASQLYSQLANLKTDNLALSNIQQYLLKKFDFSLQNLEEKLLQFKSESIAYLEKIDRVDSLWQFSEQAHNMDFNLVGEAITRLFNNQIIKVTNFSEQVEFLSELFIKISALFTANQQFITAHKEQLRINCKTEYVEEQFEALFNEWQSEINAIEQHYFPIIEACFIGTISQAATLETLSLFENYRHAVDTFFLTERIALIHEYHENPKSTFLQKIDMESQLFKRRSELRDGLKSLISQEAQHLTKKLLNAESQSLLAREIGQLLTVSQEANISQALQAEFNELQQRNLEIYLADVEQYGHEVEQRNKAIKSLLFKMKKDLEQYQNQ